MHKIRPSSLKVTNFTRNTGSDVQNVYNVPKVYPTKYIGRLTDENSRTPLSQTHSKLTFKTKSRTRRDYNRKISRIGDSFRQIDRSKKRQRDEICTENCMTIRNGRIIKKKDLKQETRSYDRLLENDDYDSSFYQTTQIPDIKTLVMINAKLQYEKEKRMRISSHSINKIYYPIGRTAYAKPIPKKSSKSPKMPSFSTLRRAYSVTAKIFPKCEVKKGEFKQDHYEEVSVPTEHSNMYPYFVDKLREAEIKKNKNTKQGYPLLKIKKKETLPLIMIVKEMSEKSKGGDRHLVYKVSNNTASFKAKKSLSDMSVRKTSKSKSSKSNLVASRQQKQNPSGKCEKECLELLGKNREHFLSASDKYKGKLTHFYSLNSRSLIIDDDYKEKLTQTIKFLLQPVIEQEHMKYHELKSGETN